MLGSDITWLAALFPVRTLGDIACGDGRDMERVVRFQAARAAHGIFLCVAVS